MRMAWVIREPGATLVAQPRAIRVTQRNERQVCDHRIPHKLFEIEVLTIELVHIVGFLFAVLGLSAGIEEQPLELR